VTVVQGLVMGVVQGLTEFLPVSSSGHLAAARSLLGVGLAEDVGFEVAVHSGTLLAVLIYFRRRIVSILVETFSGRGEGRRWLIWLVVGTIPAGVAGLALKNHAAALFNDIQLVGAAWLFTAALLLAAERFSRVKVSVDRMGILRAFGIGLAQAAALVPGISRSGATISIGLLSGVQRRGSVDFAFILSLPSVGGATMLTIPEWVSGTTVFGAAHIAGGIAAGLSGYLAIALMLRVVTGGKLGWFALYCAIIGVVALLLG